MNCITEISMSIDNERRQRLFSNGERKMNSLSDRIDDFMNREDARKEPERHIRT